MTIKKEKFNGFHWRPKLLKCFMLRGCNRTKVYFRYGFYYDLNDRLKPQAKCSCGGYAH